LSTWHYDQDGTITDVKGKMPDWGYLNGA
jgi:hypothetical protein